MMLKAFPLAHFSMVLLLKRQIIISVNKTLKALVRLTKKIDRFLEKFAQKFPQNRPYFIDCFTVKVTPKNSREINLFSANLSLQIPRILTFFSPRPIRSPVCSINLHSVHVNNCSYCLFDFYYNCCQLSINYRMTSLST